MTTNAKQTVAEMVELEKEIRTLEATEIHVETNQGTYGAAEACRAIGTGDPRFANREVYETVGGAKRATGPDEDDAPGRMRQIGRGSLAEARKELKRLREELRRARK